VISIVEETDKPPEQNLTALCCLRANGTLWKIMFDFFYELT
jgi:hypothetical protein